MSDTPTTCPSCGISARTNRIDTDALDAIATMLTDPDWGVGMLEDIAEWVTSTGRSTENMIGVDGEPISTWSRH